MKENSCLSRLPGLVFFYFTTVPWPLLSPFRGRVEYSRNRHLKPLEKRPKRRELDLFIKVLRLLCPNLTDASLRLGFLRTQEPAFGRRGPTIIVAQFFLHRSHRFLLSAFRAFPVLSIENLYLVMTPVRGMTGGVYILFV